MQSRRRYESIHQFASSPSRASPVDRHGCIPQGPPVKLADLRSEKLVPSEVRTDSVIVSLLEFDTL